MQEAINEISYFMDRFPNITSIDIIDSYYIRLNYAIHESFEYKNFTSSIELKDWCEDNLKLKK